MKKILCASMVSLIALAAPAAARQLTIDDVTMLSRVAAPDVSKDGHWLVWQQRETDLAIDGGRFDLWRLDLTKKGAVPEKLVAEGDVDETSPQFSADGATVYFQSNKGGDDAVWSVPITGGAPKKLTSFKGGMGGFKVAPTGDKLLIFADRKPGAPSLEPAMEKKDPNAGNARTFDQLFVRHWASWADGNRSQIFVLPLTAEGAPGNGVAIEGRLVGDTPSKPMGGSEEISWSADGKTVYFALREAGRIEPLSVNLDIFAAPADGSSAPVNLTAGNHGMDNLPTVSPDGKSLAWFAMKRPGYEADRQVLMVRDLASGTVRALTESWDRSVGHRRGHAGSPALFGGCHQRQDHAADATRQRVGGGADREGRGVRDEQPDRAGRFLPAFRQEAGAADLGERGEARRGGYARGDAFQFQRGEWRYRMGLCGEAGRPGSERQGADRLYGPWWPARLEQQ
jgi:dipeptidyl aminopeptidase/acylaminoacyl peptidase